MKILFLTNRIPYPLNDGGNIATFQVADGLALKGHEVHIAALNTRKHHMDIEQLPSQVAWHCVDIDTRLTMPGLAGGFFSTFPYNVKRFRSAEYSQMLKNLQGKDSFDIIQIEGIYMGMYVAEIRNLTNAPVILRSHNVEHRIWEGQYRSEKSILQRLYLKNLVPKIRKFEEQRIHEFDGIIAITEVDEKWYRQQGYKGKILSIPAGVQVARLSTVREKEQNTGRSKKVAFIGSLEWIPNLDGVRWFLNETWPHILKAWPDAEFHLAGKGAPQEISGWKIKGLKFHGTVHDAKEFITACDVFVVPLRSGSGMRLKILEAMSLGMPVVSTRSGAEGIPVTQKENIWIADEPLEISKAVRYLFENQEFANKMGEQGAEFVRKNFESGVLIEKFISFYDLLRNNRS